MSGPASASHPAPGERTARSRTTGLTGARLDAARLDAATSALTPPMAVADLTAFDRNAADLRRRANGKPIRLATKSLRCRELIRRALAHQGFSGLMCYSLPEALWLHRTGLSTDILVAYPTVDRDAIRELAADPDAAAAITLTIDSTDHLDLIESAVGKRSVRLRLCLEIDASWRPLDQWRVGARAGTAARLESALHIGGLHIGALRSPVHTPRQATDLARAVLARRRYHLVGLLMYEGQIAGIGDAPIGKPLRAALLRWMRRRSAAELARRRQAVATAVRELAPLEFINGGGTGSLESTSAEPSVSEVAAGSGLLGPALFDNYRDFGPEPVVLFALPVVRRPDARTATLLVGGYPASGPAGADRLPSPSLPRGLRLTSFEGAGEVQTPVVGRAARELDLGDRVWFRHAKSGEPAERFDEYHLLEADSTGQYRHVETVPTYRGEGRSFG